MKWRLPPKIKIYEALGCLADNRLEVTNSQIKVFSSSRNKYYSVKFDEKNNAIMANDNGSYWAGYLGYPSIAYLMKIGKLPFNEEYSQALKNIAWKDINVKNKNNFEKSQSEIDSILEGKGINLKKFHAFVDSTLEAISKNGFTLLNNKQIPPQGY